MGDEQDEFRNLQTPADALPDYRSIDFEPVAAGFRGYTVLTTSMYWLPVALVAGAINLLPDVTLLPGLLTPFGVLALAALIGVYRWVDAGRRGWALRGHDIAAAEGIFWRKVTLLPFARIQHVETSSGPIERWKGLARLKLYTAGGMTADLVLLGLDAATADTLREHLAEQIRLRDATAESTAEPPTDSKNDATVDAAGESGPELEKHDGAAGERVEAKAGS